MGTTTHGIAALAAMVMAAGTASAQSTWVNDLGGAWSDDANWNTPTAPLGAGESAILPNLGMPYEVVCSTNPAIDALSIDGPGQSLVIGDGRTFRIVTAGGVINQGLVTINQNASVFDTRLAFDPGLGNVALTGAGGILLNGAGNPGDARIVVDTGTNLMLSQGVSGAGQIEATGLVAASAPITANVPTFDLRITGNLNLTGAGTLEGTNGGFVAVNANVTGGSFLGGVEIAASSASLDGVTMSGANAIRENITCAIGGGGIVNNGVFTLNTTASVFDAELQSDAPCSITGTGTFDLNGAGQPNDARILTTDGNPITIGSGITITGNGAIRGDSAPITMLGTVIADRAGEDLDLQGTFDFMDTGSTDSAGGIVLLATADVSNADFLGSTDMSGSSSITDCNNDGTLRLRGGSNASLLGSLTNNDTLIVNHDFVVFNTILSVDSTSCIIDGTGTIQLQSISDPADAQISIPATSTLTIDAGQTIQGSGRISALGTTTINGSIVATDPAISLLLTGICDLTNAAAMGTMGTVEFNGADLTGGAFNGGVEFSGTTDARGFTSSASLGIRQNTTLNLDDDITNNGTITINTVASVFDAELTATQPVTINGTGTIFLNGAGTPGDAQVGADNISGFLTLPATQTITGNGRIDGPTDVLGTVSPGTDDLTAGNIGMLRDVAMGNSTDLFLDFIDVETYDVITGSADLTLEGTIHLRLQDGYVPDVGDRFDIIDASTIIGVFPSVDTPIIDGRLFRVIENAGDVEALWTCIGDVNLDGALSPTDFTAWINAYNTGNVEVGDQNLDGNLSPTDFTAWIANFNSGC